MQTTVRKNKIQVGDNVVDTRTFLSKGRVKSISLGGLAKIEGDLYEWSEFVWNLRKV